MSKENKFHGMTVVTDYDQTTVKGQSVIEMNSNNELVCRNYDQDGNADDEWNGAYGKIVRADGVF